MSTQQHIRNLKKGDIANPVKAQFLTEDTRQPIDLSSHQDVRFKMLSINDDSTVSTLVEGDATILDATKGIVQYEWKIGDTATAGNHVAQFILFDEDGDQETFPAEGYIEIRIEDLP